MNPHKCVVLSHFFHPTSSLTFRPSCSTVFDAKRLIGRKFADAEVQSDMKRQLFAPTVSKLLILTKCATIDWPFKIVDQGTKPIIQVEYRGETKLFTPEEISSMILLKMKETAEAYLGTTVVNAGQSRRTLPRFFVSLTLFCA